LERARACWYNGAVDTEERRLTRLLRSQPGYTGPNHNQPGETIVNSKQSAWCAPAALTLAAMLLVTGTAHAQIVDIPEANVIGFGCIPMESDYVPHVVACENFGASFEALKAQAVAARTYAYYRLMRTGAIANGSGDQVYACVNQPQAQHYAAVDATECEVLTFPGTLASGVISSFYVAGALTTYNGIPPIFMNIGSDPFNTEQYVTYNFGLTGNDIEQTTLGFTTPNPLDFPDNRGCMSQNGSDTLSDNGWNYVDILKFYYGDDISITVVPDCGNGPPLPACTPPDCNENGVDDAIDLAGGTSADCNESGVPDECELTDNDCNLNGVPDECDFLRIVTWSDDFDSNTAADWALFNHGGDYTAQFFFNYAVHGIPPAPSTVGGTTRGLKFTVNSNDGVAAIDAVSAYPIGLNFSGNYALEFDMWMNYNGGPAGGGGTGTTEYATAGINHLGNKVVWRSNAASDGFWFAVTGEGGANQDYEAVRGATVLTPAQGGFVANSLNASNAFYQALFPHPDFESPGSPGKNWVRVSIMQDAGVITWAMNGTVIASRADTTVTSGNIMLGYQDIFASISGPGALNFVIYDNVRVTLPPTDCNGNGEPDECDVVSGFSLDCNANATPDDCELIAGGDFNADASVDALDGEAFVECLAGPLASPTPGDPLCVPACLAAFDDDGDGDLDLQDFAAFMRGVTE